MKNLNLSEMESKKPIAMDSKGNYLQLKDIEKKRPFRDLATLDPKQQKNLVLERNKIEKDYEISILGSEKINKAQLMKEIEDETELGLNAVRAELSYLSDIQAEAADKPLVSEEDFEKVEMAPWPPEKYKWVLKKWWPIFFRRYAVFAEDTDTTITKAAAQYRKAKVIPCFIKQRITPIILTGSNDTRANFKNACLRKGVVYISGVGHGSPTAYTGYRYDRLLEIGGYDPREVKGKIIHLLSCKTAQQLGPDVVRNGACAYFGYFENFTITWDHPNTFWICDSSIDLALCRGANARAAATFTIKIYNYWIRKMRAIHGPTATWLTWDRDALRTPIHGRQYGNPNCTLRRVPFFEELEEELQEMEIEEMESIEYETFNYDELYNFMTEEI